MPWPVDRADVAVASTSGIGAEPLGVPPRSPSSRLPSAFLAHPIGDQPTTGSSVAPNSWCSRWRSRRCCGRPRCRPSAFQANPKKVTFAAGESHACDLALAARSPKPPGTRIPWTGSSIGATSVPSANNSASSQLIRTLTRFARRRGSAPRSGPVASEVRHICRRLRSSLPLRNVGRSAISSRGPDPARRIDDPERSKHFGVEALAMILSGTL